jgi:hypothetical protein
MKALIKILGAVFFGVIAFQLLLLLLVRIPYAIVVMTIISYGLVFLIIVTIMKRAGRLPAFSEEPGPVRKEGEVFFVSRSRFRYHGSVCAVALTEYALVVYGFCRPRLVVSQADTIELVKSEKGSFLRIYQDRATYEIHVTGADLWKADIEAYLKRR